MSFYFTGWRGKFGDLTLTLFEIIIEMLMEYLNLLSGFCLFCTMKS